VLEVFLVVGHLNRVVAIEIVIALRRNDFDFSFDRMKLEIFRIGTLRAVGVGADGA